MARGSGGKRKYLYLLDDPDIMDWYNNIANQSELTADTYLRRLGWLDERGIDPRRLPKKDSKKIKSDLIGLINKMNKEGKMASYIESVIKAVRSWLNHNEIEIQHLNLPVVQESEKYKDEVVPMKQELTRILDAADIRGKIPVSVMAFAGQRPQVLGAYKARDGLELRDFPELQWDERARKAKFKKTPSYFRVRTPISKRKYEYISFLPDQACRYIVQYLEMRMAEGEVLKPSSALLTSVWGRMREVEMDRWEVNPETAGAHITTGKVERLVKIAMESAGVNKRPYVLRRLYESQMLLNAPSEGLILSDYVNFFAGYTGPIAHRYILHKGLQPEIIEEMRRQYKKAADKYLATEKGETRDEMLAEMRKQLLLFVRYTADEVSKMGDLSAIPQEKFGKLLDKKRNDALGLHGNTQKVVRN